MTRRQRHTRIIESFGAKRACAALEQLLARHGDDLLTDDAVEKLARLLLNDRAFAKRLNERNRQIAARRLS